MPSPSNIQRIVRVGNTDNELNQINKNFELLKELLTNTELSLEERATLEQLLAVEARVTELETDVDALGSGNNYGFEYLSSSTAVVIEDAKHDTTYANSSASSITVTLPATGLDSSLGKRLHFAASSVYSSSIVVTCVTPGIARDSGNASAPFTVTSGTLTATVSRGLLGFYYYSISGNYT